MSDRPAGTWPPAFAVVGCPPPPATVGGALDQRRCPAVGVSPHSLPPTENPYVIAQYRSHGLHLVRPARRPDL